MKLTAKDKARADQYRNCKPKQFGNLHERMQYVMKLLNRGHTASSIENDLWYALFDLEAEVSYHKPQNRHTDDERQDVDDNNVKSEQEQ